MKLLHVSESEGLSGAGRAASRIHQALRASPECISEMLVARRSGPTQAVHLLEPNNIHRMIMSAQRRLLDQEVRLSRTPNQVFRSPARMRTAIPRAIQNIAPDAVLIHWIGSRMASVEQIGRLKHPKIWILHDSWTFTGAEHHPHGDNDRRFVNGYDQKNRLPGEFGLDINRRVWDRKRASWTENMGVIAPSKWIEGMARASYFADRFTTCVIPNPLDIRWWSSVNRMEARDRLGISANEKLVAFGGIRANVNPSKGIDLAYEALRLLPSLLVSAGVGSTIRAVEFGSTPRKPERCPIPVTSLGYLDDNSLRDVYSAADVVVVPSRIDNYPQTAVESTTCGTPVAGFRIGGLTDIVVDGVTGRLATPFDSLELAHSIAWILEDSARHAELSSACLRRAKMWDPNLAAAAYISFIKHFLKE